MKKIIPLITLFIVAACGPALATDEPAPPQPAPGVVQPPVEDTPATPGPETTPRLAEIAIQDLAARLDLSPESITFISMNPVTWPDASLGCPAEGMMYAQVETEGYIIWLQANDSPYRYHTDTDEQVVFCERPGLPGFPVTPGEIDDGVPWVPVD